MLIITLQSISLHTSTNSALPFPIIPDQVTVPLKRPSVTRQGRIILSPIVDGFQSKIEEPIKCIYLQSGAIGHYDPKNKTAFFKEGNSNTISYTDVVEFIPRTFPQLPPNIRQLSNGSPNPAFISTSLIKFGYLENKGATKSHLTYLYGIPTNCPEEPSLGTMIHTSLSDHQVITSPANDALQNTSRRTKVKGLTIYGFKDKEKGVYDRKSKIADIHNVFYNVLAEYIPLQADSKIPEIIENATLFACVHDKPTCSGQTNPKVYLYGVPLPIELQNPNILDNN